MFIMMKKLSYQQDIFFLPNFIQISFIHSNFYNRTKTKSYTLYSIRFLYCRISGIVPAKLISSSSLSRRSGLSNINLVKIHSLHSPSPMCSWKTTSLGHKMVIPSSLIYGRTYMTVWSQWSISR